MELGEAEGCPCFPAAQASAPSLDRNAMADFQPFPFMKLPQEIRLMVYQEHLTFSGIISVEYVSGCYSSTRHLTNCSIHDPPCENRDFFNRSILNLFLVSKSINNEAVPLFFRNNVFHFLWLTSLEHFLSTISIPSRRSLASVSFDYRGSRPAKSLKPLKECIGLRELKMTLGVESLRILGFRFGRPETCSFTRLYGLGELTKIRGLRSVDVLCDPTLKTHYFLLPNFQELLESMLKLRQMLDVMLKPRSASRLAVQDHKDFPKPKKRTVFGKANVVTRGEKRILGST